MTEAFQTDPVRTLYLGANTLTRMEPRQLAGIGERKLRDLLIPRVPVDFDHRYERSVPTDPTARTDAIAADTAALRDSLSRGDRSVHRTSARAAAAGTPTFMNRTVRIVDDGTVEWFADRLADLPPLWRWKLYTFEPMASVVQGFDPAEADDAVRRALDGWIHEWIETVTIGEAGYLRREWTPWSVSLRVQHWLRYLAWRERVGSSPTDEGFATAFRREIYKNALFLRNHVERDVGGNHLIENGAALLTAGIAFEEHGTDWLETGLTILEEEADRQFLSDGCHYERSPMYHVLVLTRYLSAVALLERSGRPVPPGIRTVATAATSFLRSLRPPDGTIPLMNDSVYGEALPLEACLRFAASVGIDGRLDNEELGETTADGRAIGGSGYHWMRTDEGAMLVDGGEVGPPHLPGHSHSDTLSFLLWIGDRPVVTDTGTFDYVAGQRRDYARGVRGHNTVQVGSAEPIAIGGQYLMGPRPFPRSRTQAGPVSLFEGSYDATPYDGADYTHHRAIFAGADWWLVEDTVTTASDAPVRSRTHLHPAVDPSVDSGGVALAIDDEHIGQLYPLNDTRVVVRESEYFPRFGEAIDRPLLELHRDGTTRPQFGGLFTTRRIAPDDLEVTDSGDRSRRLVLGDDVIQLPTLELLGPD